MKKRTILCLIAAIGLQLTACGSEPIKDTVIIDDTQYETNNTEETTQTQDASETLPQTTTEEPVITEEVEAYEPEFTFTRIDYKPMWAIDMQAVYAEPAADSDTVYFVQKNEEVTVIGQCNENLWYKIQCPDAVGYINNAFLTDIDPATIATPEPTIVPTPEPTQPAPVEKPQETTQPVATAAAKPSFQKNLYEPISYDNNSVYWYYIIGNENSDSNNQAKQKAQSSLNAQNYMYYNSRGICTIGDYEQGTVGIWLAETFSNTTDYNTNKSSRETYITNNINNYK